MRRGKKEKPIIFNTEMVQAILDGRKTQTRRVMKPQPIRGWQPCDYGTVHKKVNGEPDIDKPMGWGPTDEDGYAAYVSPYGKPNDELWVRETFVPNTDMCQEEFGFCDTHEPTYRYKADVGDEKLINERGWPWKPSIFMPREASRIQLLVTDVRVERLQEMDNTDIMEEGVKPLDTPEHEDPWVDFENKYVDAFKQLWNSINADRGYSWESNPWVWVVEFKVIEVRK